MSKKVISFFFQILFICFSFLTQFKMQYRLGFGPLLWKNKSNNKYIKKIIIYILTYQQSRRNNSRSIVHYA